VSKKKLATMKSVTLCKLLLVNSLVIIACNKESSPAPGCATDAPTERTLANKAATVKEIGGKFYIVEQNTVDTKLLPCNLDASFAVDNLQVTVSGEVKKTNQTTGGPCCTNNFIISSITR
jgi:hypothetical protein